MNGTVVLCGSLGATAAMWDGQRETLAGFRVVDVEHPGHGAASVGDARDLDAFARRVLDAVDGPFSSTGFARRRDRDGLAADHPERVERLVLACTAERFGEPAQWHEAGGARSR